MSEQMYTKRRSYQFGGPFDSADYNAQVEERYKDLVALYNNVNSLNETVGMASRTTTKDVLGIIHKVDELEDRVLSLEREIISGQVSFKGMSSGVNIDTDRFAGTAYDVAEIDRLVDNPFHQGIVLPPAGSTSMFQSAIVLNGNTPYVPDSVEVNIEGVTGSADSIGSVIDTTQPELSFGRTRGMNWERNVITSSIDSQGAILDLYIAVPSDVSPNAKSNYLAFRPYPIYSMDILSVAVSTTVQPSLEDSDNYVPLNKSTLYSGNDNAVGIIAPGAWNGDEDLQAGNRLWIFDPRQVTAVKIRIRQRNYYVENSNYVYTYGANHIDVGYAKTLDEGRTLVRFTPPDGHTVSNITDVVPQIYNIPQAYLVDCFSYRVVWETGTDSGIYTDNPVAFSNKAWVEVTLKRAPDGTIPMLTGLFIEAS